MASAQQEFITSHFVTQLKQQPSLPHDSWYFISAAVLCALNRRDDVPILFQYAIEDVHSLGDRQKIAARYREALIKVIPVSGMPKVSSVCVTLLSLVAHY